MTAPREHEQRPQARSRPARVDADAATVELRAITSTTTGASWPARQVVAAGIAMTAMVVGLGLVAKLPAVTGMDLRLDRHIAVYDRSPMVTPIAATLTGIATPGLVGVAALVVLPLGLWVARRRLEAVRALSILGTALTLAVLAKSLIAEHRPPVALWAIPADSGASYPSGHTTVAAALAATLIAVAGTRRWRTILAVLGGLYTVGVAASRIYLANHYLPDVLGSLLTALAAVLLVTGFLAAPPIARVLQRLGIPR